VGGPALGGKNRRHSNKVLLYTVNARPARRWGKRTGATGGSWGPEWEELSNKGVERLQGGKGKNVELEKGNTMVKPLKLPFPGWGKTETCAVGGNEIFRGRRVEQHGLLRKGGFLPWFGNHSPPVLPKNNKK